MNFTIRNDQPDDFITILREVGQWLNNSGQGLWQVENLTPEKLFDDYTRGNCFVLYAHQEDGLAIPAATFILQWKDPLYYADVPDNTAGFIHKLAIRRMFGGQSLFAIILDFCRDTCLKRGIRELQLETDATRPALMRFYERYGFQPIYQKSLQKFGKTFLFQYYVLQF